MFTSPIGTCQDFISNCRGIQTKRSNASNLLKLHFSLASYFKTEYFEVANELILPKGKNATSVF